MIYLISLTNHSLHAFHNGDYAARRKIISQGWKAYDIWHAMTQFGHEGKVLKYSEIDKIEEGSIVLIQGGWFSVAQQEILMNLLRMPIKLIALNEDDVLQDFRKAFKEVGLEKLAVISNHDDPEYWLREKGGKLRYTMKCTYPNLYRIDRKPNEIPSIKFGYVGNCKASRKTVLREFVGREDLTLTGYGWIKNGFNANPHCAFVDLQLAFQVSEISLHFSDARWKPFGTLTPRVAQSLCCGRPLLFHKSVFNSTPKGIKIPDEWFFKDNKDLDSAYGFDTVSLWKHQCETLLPYFEVSAVRIAHDILEKENE